VTAAAPNSERTDIWGALLAAGQRFQNTCGKAVLLLFSDMNDTCARYYAGISLHGAEVLVLDYQSGNSDTEVQAFWTDAMIRRCARSVRFVHVDEPIPELP